jgi:hypothetical protein
MSGTILTGNFARLMQEGVMSTFGNTYAERPKDWMQIFADKTSGKNYEVMVQVEGYGLAAIKNEGDEITFDTRRQGFTPKFVMTTYGKGITVSEECMEDELYDIPIGQASSLARAMGITEETVSFNVINRAFDATALMIDGDGKSLIATDHQLGPTNTGTFSNKLSTDAAFAEASYEAILIQMDRAVDARGLPIKLQAMKLLGASENKFEFERVTGSVLQNNTANNAVNATSSIGSLRNGWMTTPFLTSTSAWFVTSDAPDGLCSFNRRALSFGEDDSFTTGNKRFKATQRYSKGWGDPRGIYGSAGTA